MKLEEEEEVKKKTLKCLQENSIIIQGVYAPTKYSV